MLFGCYAQVAEEEIKKIKEIDFIVGTNEKNDIVNAVENFQNTHIAENGIGDVMHQKEFIDFGNVTYTDKTRAVIKVQDGCDRFCTYCIIPYARGRVRSRTIKSVIAEVKEIVELGIKEIVITGIHVASYGKDFKEDISLIDLLEEINKIDGLERIRLSSIEPTIISKEFVERLKKIDKICNHFHLSLQSGCNETLKRMNRRYTIEEFKESVKLLRNTYTDVALTTDIIVGFPGETEEEFETTYKNLKEINFYMLHVFKYSPRKGTKAAEMPDQISNEIKEERSKKLIELSNNSKNEFNKQFIGKKEKVLWEQEENGKLKGHTSNYILVYCDKKEGKLHNIQDVEIIGKKDDGLIGKVIIM